MSKEVAVIGVGRMGRYHCRVLYRLGHLCAISDIKPTESLKKEYNVPIYTDYIEMIEKHPEIEGVIVATPTESHAKIAEELLNIKQLKAILIEKPLADSIDDALRLKKLADKSDIQISVGHIEVYNPVIQRMLNLLKENAIVGEIRSIIIQRRGAVSDGRLESIGDVYQDIGIHDFDLATRILPHGAYSVVANAVSHNKISNSATIVFSNPNITCTFLLSREFAGKIRKVEIEGSKATMVIDLLDQFIEIRQLGIAKGDTKSITVPFGSGERIKVYGEPLMEEIWNFIDTINGNKPLVNIDAGIKAVELVDIVRKADKSKSSEIIQI